MLSFFDVLPTLAQLSDCAEDWQSVKQILDMIFFLKQGENICVRRRQSFYSCASVNNKDSLCHDRLCWESQGNNHILSFQPWDYFVELQEEEELEKNENE